MLIKELMVNEVKMVDANDTILSAATFMSEHNIGALPVRQNDRLIGMLTDRDIITRVIAEGRRPEDVKVREAMTAGMKYCYEDEESSAICDNMRSNGVRRLTVMTRDKRLIGIVSLSDIEEPERAKAA
jgi:CBS domain-containing protein